MKHLIKIVTNEINHERRKPKKYTTITGTRQKRMAYKINGFWFCLTRRNWSEFRGIGYNTLCGRDKAGKTIGQILGFEEYKKYKRRV
jgi:hypothetical protein